MDEAFCGPQLMSMGKVRQPSCYGYRLYFQERCRLPGKDSHQMQRVRMQTAKEALQKRFEPESISSEAVGLNEQQNAIMLFASLMSIVLNVHPGVQLDTRVDSKKSFCRSVMEGT